MTVDPIGRFEKEHDVALAALARLEAAAEALRGGGAFREAPRYLNRIRSTL